MADTTEREDPTERECPDSEDGQHCVHTLLEGDEEEACCFCGQWRTRPEEQGSS